MTTQEQQQKQMLRAALAQTEWLSHEDLSAYQQQQLRQIATFAAQQSPFYGNRLKHVFRRDGSIDMAAWHDVPVLTRGDLRVHGTEFQSKELPPGHGPGIYQASSGTTGEPVEFLGTMLHYHAGNAAQDRANRWYGFDKTDRTCVGNSKAIVEAMAKSGNATFENGKLTSDSVSLALNWSSPPEQLVAAMLAHKSTCLLAFCTMVEAIAEYEAEHATGLRLKFAVGLSMAFNEPVRALTKRALHCETYSLYSSKEGGKIAHECPASGGMHVNDELMLLEIVDENDAPCGPGQIGRVLLTPFLATAQPLIRYETGDLASWATAPCPCGRAHSLLHALHGRTRHQFIFDGTGKITPGLGHAAYLNYLHADKWQVAQIGPRDVEVRFTSRAPDEARNLEAMTDILCSSLGVEVRVDYRRMDRIPLTSSGKYIEYVNEFTTSA